MNRLLRLTCIAAAAAIHALPLWAEVCDPDVPCDVLMPGDFDQDGDVDGDDRVLFEACAAGPAIPLATGCEYVDLDGDGDGDQSDFGLWQRLITGSCACPPPIKEPPNGQIAGPTRNVYLFSGEVYETAVDLHIPSVGIDFVWGRKYRSRIGPSTAAGHGWDHSYNIFVEAAGDHLRLHDGNTRSDVYRRQTDGTWTRPEFFTALSHNPDDTYTLTFPDKLTWHFHPLDGSPTAGKLARIADRHGNEMTFDYDQAGRLTVVRDPLHTQAQPREILVAYSTDGLVSSVTDYVGRQVTYAYYDGLETGGNAGDLKSVTTPAVTGTPTGNDFPNGKTTTYTYTTGFADDRLNHNLLTITDPKGQTYLQNVYSSATDPSDPNFDRVVRQVYGDSGDVLDVVHLPQTPSPANNGAVSLAIVNDRVGNVSEYFYDARNRCVLNRAYTGRADPDQPTTDSTNRPVNPLRPGDPTFYETSYAYNTDSLLTSMVDPNGGEVQLLYDEKNPSAHARGNLLEQCTLPGPLGGDQLQLCESSEFDPIFQLLTRHVDPKGNETLHQYDAAGNRTQTTHRLSDIVEDFEYDSAGRLTAHIHPDNGSNHRRRDEFSYYASGPSTGYLHQAVIDAGAGLHNLTTTYEYDPVGNVTRVIDPRGHDTLYVVNQLNQVVRQQSRQPDPDVPYRYILEMFYDANDNVVRADVENRDEAGTLQSNGGLTTLYAYDTLNHLVRRCAESGEHDVPRTPPQLDCTNLPASEFVTTEYEYDANRNRTLVRSPEAVENRQADNVVQYLYDERDLLFRATRAPGSTDQSTMQYDYDGNGNLSRQVTGLEDAASPRVTTFSYDGYDRLVSTTDPMGNVSAYHYDANGNVTSARTDGELEDQPGDAGNVRLSETTYLYDAMDRLSEIEEAHFDAATQAPIDDGKNEARFFRSRSGHILMFDDDKGNSTRYAYDTANRLEVITDAKDNTTTYAYDANSNVTSVTEVDKSDLGLPDETFGATYEYDSLDRRVRVIDSVGNTDRYQYDSRDNLVVSTDAAGQASRFIYDSLDRVVQTVRDIDGDGPDGDGDDITITCVWDDNSRLTQQIDDNGHATTYEYDALSRTASLHFADNTSEIYAYDVHDNMTSRVDANGSTVLYDYDPLDRVTHKTIAVAPGVAATTTFETFAYDGLGRLTESQDDGVIQTFTWTSLSHPIQQTTNGQTTSATYDGVGNMLSITYPGGRQISYTYDTLNRMATAADAQGQIVARAYVGPDRLALQQLGNGTRTVFAYDGIQGVPNPQGDFGVKKIVGTAHSNGPVSIDARTYQWDPLYRKTQRADVRAGGPRDVHLYGYDPSHRLTRGRKTNSFGVTVRDTIYNLDGVGNRLTVEDLGGVVGTYLMDPTTPQPADAQVNQYTSTHADNRQYDENGNLRLLGNASGTRTVEYDYADRIVSFADNTTGLTATYRYDPLGRRIAKTVHTQGLPTPPVEKRFYYGLRSNLYPFTVNRVVEEQDDTGTTQATYVYAGGDTFKWEFFDAAGRVSMQRGGNDYYYHGDDLGNVMAVTDSTGAVVERYEYGDYGAPAFSDGAGRPLTKSAIENPYLFTGQQYDSETGWYCFPARYLDPQAGRFVSRDPIGTWADGSGLGNAYTYAGNSPWTNTDPTGLMNKAELIDAIAKESKLSKSITGRGTVATGRIETGIAARGEGLMGLYRAGGSARASMQLRQAAIAQIQYMEDRGYFPKRAAGGGGGGVCPPDRPVLCPNRMCARQASDCPTYDYAEPLFGNPPKRPPPSQAMVTNISQMPAVAGDPLKEESHFAEVTGLDVTIDQTEYLEGGTLNPRKGPGASGGGGPRAAQVSRSFLKNYFQSGKKPTQSQFSNLIDSYIHRLDDGVYLYPGGGQHGSVGPVRWMAPEALARRAYSGRGGHEMNMGIIRNMR